MSVLDLLLFAVLSWVLPVVINKTTEGHFHWIKPHLRLAWAVIFVFFSAYLLQKPAALEITMKLHRSWPGMAGYVVSALLGAVLLCGYWWMTGKMLTAQPHTTEESKPEGQSQYTNEQIKDSAMALSRRLREFQRQMNDDDSRASDLWMKRMAAGSKKKKKQEEAMEAMRRDREKLRAQHEQSFGPLRAESKNIIFHLSNRVPAPQPIPNPLLKFALFNGAGPNPAYVIADYIDQLALLVPVKR